MELAQGYAVSAASIAALLDLRSRRIPNWITFGTLVVGVALNAWLHGLEGALGAVVGAAVGLAILLPFYAMGVMGAGDVKLLAGLGAVLGVHVLVSVAIYAAIVGGALSAVILLLRGRLFLTLNEMFVQHRLPSRSGATAPYGVAIASGVYLSLVLPAVLG